MNNYLKTFLCLGLALLLCTQAAAADYATFESIYDEGGIGILGWTVFCIFLVISIIAAIYSSGAALPWMTSLGSYIGGLMGLSGAAATKAGLALLGGGALAKGGFGIAGGIALLGFIASFTSDTLFGIGADKIVDVWTRYNLIQENRNMLTLPLPKSDDGGDAYEATMDYLEENLITPDEPGRDADPEAHELYGRDPQGIALAANQQVLHAAIDKLRLDMKAETTKKYQLKDKVLLSLLCLHTYRYSEAARLAEEALALAGEIEECPSLPSYIKALCRLADPDTPYDKETHNALQAAYHQEPDNYMMPLMTACCLDRMMYKYHHGRLAVEDLANFSNIFTDECLDSDYSGLSALIFASRGLIELKVTQQEILVVTGDMDFAADAGIIKLLRQRYAQHEAVLTLLQQDTLGKVESRTKLIMEHLDDAWEEAKPYLRALARRSGAKERGRILSLLEAKEAPTLTPEDLKKTLEGYRADLPRLKTLIDNCEARLNAAAEQTEPTP